MPAPDSGVQGRIVWRLRPEEVLERALRDGRPVLESALDAARAALGARAVTLVERSPGAEEAIPRGGVLAAAFRQGRPCLVATGSGVEGEVEAALPVVLGGEVRAVLHARGLEPPPAGDPAVPEQVERDVRTLLGTALLLARTGSRGGSGERERERGASAERATVPSGGRLELEGAERGERARSELAALFPEVVGVSPAMRDLLRTVSKLAASDIPVLIEGESGTGKELVATAIHRLSRRRWEPFVTENCGALPESLIEAELFGFEKGAFTGAARCQAGILERAHRGTLFLDEVGELDLQLQKRFLRVLQEREVRRLGSTLPSPVDFRLLSATNRNLEELMLRGLFRDDLFYRLQGASISVPPLRERREDIQLLVAHFACLFAAPLERPELEFTGEAMGFLEAYSWPGNVRELRNEVWRLAVSTSGPVGPQLLSKRILRKVPARRLPSPRDSLWTLEKEILGGVIREVLERCGGNRAQAAKELGIGRATLYRRLKRYGIAP